MSRRETLRVKHTLQFSPTAPFNFDATMHKPDHFPSTDNDWQPGVRWQTMLWRGVQLGLRIENRGTVGKPRVRVSVWAGRRLERQFLDSLRDEITYRYNLRLDLTEFNRRFAKDPQLGPVIRKWRGMRPMSYCSLYEGMIIMIVLQNCTVQRSVNMLQALFERYGTRLSYDNKELHCYWPPDTIDRASEQELRQLKVGYRAKNIKRVTEAFARGGFDEMDLRRKSRDEQRTALLGLYGIGPASVGYTLFDGFHHWDEFEHISPWEQKIYSKLFFDVEPGAPVPVDQLLRLFNQRFGDCRALAVHYLWEDLWWKSKNQHIPWLEKLIRL